MKKLIVIILILTSFYCRSQTPITFGKVTINSDVATSSTTPVDVTSLSFPVTANDTYYFKIVIGFTTNATTTGSSWGINGPALTILESFTQWTLTAQTSSIRYADSYDAMLNSATSASGNNTAIIEGTIRCSANGTVIARFQSEVVSPGTVTVQEELTYLIYQKIK